MSDVTVHIDETLDVSTFQALQNNLFNMKGIQHINSSQKHPHLMVVQYDHHRIDSSMILRELENHGVHAELIGF